MHEGGVGVVVPQEEAEAQGRPREPGHEYDLAIVGGGPAGLAAAVSAVGKALGTLLISRHLGGQVPLGGGVEGHAGVEAVEGTELVQSLEERVRREAVETLLGRTVAKVSLEPPGFRLLTEDGAFFKAATVIIATGKTPRPLNVPGERELLGRGVSYCAPCHAPLFVGRDVAVVGAGDSALAAIHDLLHAGAPRVYFITTHESPQGDAIEKIRSLRNVELHADHEVLEIGGAEGRVTNIVVRDRRADKTKILEVEGVFVETGVVANSDVARGLVERNESGEIITDSCGRTTTPGVFAAGDVTAAPDKHIIVAVGDGWKAALSAWRYLVQR
jgi:alkyl hydroperoxide reductase subunit AhpF